MKYLSPHLCQKVYYQNEVTSVGEDVEETESLYNFFAGNKKLVQPYMKNFKEIFKI